MALDDGNSGGGDTGGAGAGNDGGAADALLGGAGASQQQGDGGDGGNGGDGGGASDGGSPDAQLATFLEQFSAEGDGDKPSLRDWVTSRGYKSIDEIAKSARDNQSALRDSGRIKVPGEGATEAELADFRTAIGVPEKPDGYEAPELKDADGNAIAMNDAKLQGIFASAHRHGIPAGALKGVLQDIAQADAAELATRETELAEKASAHADSWKDDRASNLAAVNRAAEALDLTREETLALRAAWGPERALDVMAKLGRGIGEDTMLKGGGKQKFGMSASEAQATLETKQADQAWVDKAMVPGSAENAEYERLNNAIAAEADRQAASGG